MCFAIVGSKAAKVHFLFLFSSFRKTEQAWKIKQSFLPPHPHFHLTQQFFLVHGVFKENTFTGIDKKEKNHQGNRAGWIHGWCRRRVLNRNKGLARPWIWAKGREGGWFLSGITNLLPHKDHGRAIDRGGCSVSTGSLWTTARCSDLKLCVAEGMS